MIKGTGIDIVSVERIGNMINKYQKKFVARVFTDEEIKYCSQKAKPAQHYAGRFAVKEAVIKVLGDVSGLNWRDFEVINDNLGCPKLLLSERAQIKAVEKGINAVHISISHENNYAVAQAVGEGE